MQRPLADDIAIYFHELEPQHWGEFRDAIQFFLGEGYRPVTASGFIQPASDGKRLFVSFDDNYRNWHRALPLFADLGLTATFYVNSLPFRDTASRSELDAYFARLNLSPDRETLSRSELVELAAAGHTIGCHSRSHLVLSKLNEGDWEREIRGCRDTLAAITGSPIEHFAWPYGMRRYFSEPLRAYCRNIGFKTIANAIPGCQRIAAQDPFNLYRTDWRFGQSLAHNRENLRIDGRAYASFLGRSVIG